MIVDIIFVSTSRTEGIYYPQINVFFIVLIIIVVVRNEDESILIGSVKSRKIEGNILSEMRYKDVSVRLKKNERVRV